MARIVFTSGAFWGDVMPYVPIANELARRGHDVTYSLPRAHHLILRGERFGLHDNRSTFTHHDVLQDPEQLRILEKQAGSTTGTALVRYWAKRYYARELDQWADATDEVLEGADVLVTHPTAAAVTAIPAQARGVPMVCGQLFPMMIPSAHVDPAGIDLRRLPAPAARTVRRAAWRAAPVLASRILQDPTANAVRARYGLAPQRGNMMTAWMRAVRTFVLASAHVHPRPPDWDPSVELIGFSLWPGPAGSTISPETAAFLDAGEPPVLVTLGTSAASVSRGVFDAVADALDRLGRRGLFLIGDEQLRAGRLERRPGVATFEPIGPVLARCSAIVHSAGLGTTAAAMAAGVPAVVLPWGFDQVAHARRAVELGVAVEASARRPRADDIARALSALDDGHARRAGDLAERLAAEDGPRRAADIVEEVAAGSAGSRS